MLRRTPSRTITEWIAYEQVYGPLGGLRADYHVALIAATIANGIQALGGKRGTRKLDSFLLKWDQAQTKRALTPAEMIAKLRSLNQAMGGKEVGKP